MNTDPQMDPLYKLLLIGDPRVGKSSLILRYCQDKYVDMNTTIGVDFQNKTIEVAGKMVKLQIWDTAGEERFSKITALYYRRTNGVVIVFDITDRASFDHVKFWLENTDNFAEPYTQKIIVGAKCDLHEERKVTTEEAQEFAESLPFPLHYVETSAKMGINVDKVFDTLANQISASPHDDSFVPRPDLANQRNQEATCF